MNMIDSNILSGMRAENRYTLFLIPLQENAGNAMGSLTIAFSSECIRVRVKKLQTSLSRLVTGLYGALVE
jgi:hypothetical protein